MNVVAVIPARWGSSRFPGKPLEARIAGVPLLQRVWALATAAPGVAEVLVATDDPRIAAFVEGLGGRAVMTDPACRNGTERMHQALQRAGLEDRPAVNVQGDAVLTPPWVIGALAAVLAEDAAAEVATPAVRMSEAAYRRLVEQKRTGQVGGTTVTFDRRGRALYFSKQVIPFLREPVEPLPVFRHIGLYGFQPAALARYVSLEPGPLERAEGLEQLRALENGMTVRVVQVDYRGRTHWAVDSPDDAAIAERLIAEEGELLARYDGSARFEPE
ncbi:3-deoxy-manno-octulosonate cytidylyltransferase (CMP-KDO synthetase) [Tistlia consotensis]|uniref:3-deoxy-manno-octulosonate cytidylyltransferase (CMP-KDO synthetase) n=1 Tax=Tistlia consotensis USBA 355 TaxID=560819 RepID=A0A1Y6CUF3_9PROT|nr:3-deoxy-manno-octulosonate cytidylyltransferase [Tistlia consotensis]SMF78858.1 3-deoxy-manno-octulosonate cytidylyltransferase (CMP-KDO synthetase) [Tistlia consotensis USBA 355]SNS14954.1 3-deoxy-manno-octulosonate cytidylyltransferase (CMP-KDO synthetase) [Tistlia consotensis]